MSKDIKKILEGWPYEPEEIIVRIVKGDDGRDKIQLRVDLGVLQMEMDGRPDGLRPEGCESWLQYYQQKQARHDASHPDTAAFQLDDNDCQRLMREGVQYYHRYLSFWHLKLYDLCARDTKRNLRLFAFVKEHAQEDKNRLLFDQWRPYVTMMYTRAVATPLLNAGQVDTALEALDSGIDAIQDFLDEYHQSHRASECVELVNLERWREEVVARRAERPAPPGSPLEVLRDKLQRAIADEEFEEAARLRDEIRRLGGQR